MTLKVGPLEKGGKATKHPLERAITPHPASGEKHPLKIVTKLPPLKEAALEKAAKPSTPFNEAPLDREAKHLPAPPLLLRETPHWKGRKLPPSAKLPLERQPVTPNKRPAKP